jgi:DNA ligase-1
MRQRGHGKRSSFYSDYTFGVWTAGENGDELVRSERPISASPTRADRDRQICPPQHRQRFGPVREVTHEAATGLVMESRSRGLQRSTRHKSGLAMRFPRISRLRWDKPPREADRA